jgi:hypothetical protein
MRADRLWRTGKEKKEWARRLQSNDPGLDVIHPQAAGIDVGNASHYVAVRPDRDPEPVRQFGCFTADLYRLADWLKSCGVVTVATKEQTTTNRSIATNSSSSYARRRPNSVSS